jgi:hypothetical protein
MFVETVESEVRTMDKVKNITDLQAELDRRTAVEKLAEKLIIEGKFEEGKALLDTLDDGKVRELMEDNKYPEKTVDLYLRVNCKDNRFPDSLNKIEEVVKRIFSMQKVGYYLNVRIVANI